MFWPKSLKQKKQEIRDRMKEIRRENAFENHDLLLGQTATLLDSMINDSGVMIAGYVALEGSSEPNILSVLENLRESRGIQILLPRIEGRDQPMSFREYNPGDELEVNESLRVSEPKGTVMIRRPDIVVVPMLAFDGQFNRLGYGGGFYDRTLATFDKVSRNRAPQVVGAAYAAQKCDKLPTNKFDRKLDAVVTENGATKRRNEVTR